MSKEYKLELIINDKIYKQIYYNYNDIKNILKLLKEKEYITKDIYAEISNFLYDFINTRAKEVDVNYYSMISPNKNIKLEMEVHNDIDDYSIDALLAHNS